MAETVSSSPPVASATQTGSLSPFPSTSPLPRVTIRFCTQCKWMLRAAYFAQELLSTFSTALGEVALQPATGGIFVVEIYHRNLDEIAKSLDPSSTDLSASIQHRVLWDRKVDGGFPETKELKRRVRDVIEPGRNLGHVDRDYPRQQQQPAKDEIQREQKTAQADVLTVTERLQPPGPRWPELNKSDPSQVVLQGQQTTSSVQWQPSANPESQANPQVISSPDDRHPRKNNTGTNDPVYNPRMVGGGIMPIMRPKASSSPSTTQEHSSSGQPLSQSNKEICEDCQ